MVMRFGIVWLESQGLLVMCRRFVELALVLYARAQVLVASG